MYHRNLATFLMNEDRFADAERELLLANAVELQPKTFWLLSEARAARGDVRGARQALEDGLAALPDKTESSTVLWLVELALRDGDIAGAESALTRQAALLAPEPAVRATAEGRIAEAKGDVSGARARYLEALRRDPRQSRAAERIAALSTMPAERAALVPFLEQALARDQRIELYWKMLGLIRLERGDAPGAAAALGRAAELEPADEEIAMTLATALMRADRTADARVVYERMAAAGSRRAPRGSTWEACAPRPATGAGPAQPGSRRSRWGPTARNCGAGWRRRGAGRGVARRGPRGRAGVPRSAQPVAERDAGPERRRAPGSHGAERAGAGVPDRPLGALAHDERTETCDRDPSPVKSVRDQAVLALRAEQRLHDAPRGGLGQARARRQPLDQFLTVHPRPPGASAPFSRGVRRFAAAAPARAAGGAATVLRRQEEAAR